MQQNRGKSIGTCFRSLEQTQRFFCQIGAVIERILKKNFETACFGRSLQDKAYAQFPRKQKKTYPQS